MKVPTILHILLQTVDTRGRSGGPQGFLPGQSSSSSAEQIMDIPAPARGVQRGLQGFSQGRSSTARPMEQNVDIPVPGGGWHDLPVPAASSSSAVSRDERGQGFFRTFLQVQESATLPPRSGSALPPHSSPWAPAAHDVPMALEEEEESESEEELGYDVEYVEFDGCWWRCEWVPLASGIAGGRLRQTGPRLAIPSGGPVAHRAWTRATWSRLVQVHGLVAFVRVGVLLVAALGVAWYKFMALWTVYEMACFFYLPWRFRPLTCSSSSSSPFR